MAKIYPDKEDVKNIQTNNTLKCYKKYFKTQNYLLNFHIFPVVLVPIIMDYVNDVYVVTYFWDDDVCVIKQITNNNNELLRKSTHTYAGGKDMYCLIDLSPYSHYTGIFTEINLFKSFEEKTIKTSDTYYYSLLGFLNYFMKQHYNKKKYFLKEHYNYYKENGWICAHDRDNDTIARKIHNPKELRNIILIFKILSKIVTKVLD